MGGSHYKTGECTDEGLMGTNIFIALRLITAVLKERATSCKFVLFYSQTETLNLKYVCCLQ